MPKEYTQANINLTKDDAHMVDTMMKSDGDVIRSAFVRKLIRKEWARRGLATPIDDASGVPEEQGAG